MKILIYCPYYAPELIGTGIIFGEIGRWLAARGHEVRVVAAPPHYPSWHVWEGYSAWAYRRERVKGTDVWRCPLWVPLRPTGVKRLLYLASFAASSFPVMLRQAFWQPDVVVSTEPPLFCIPQALLTARLCGAKTVLRIEDFEVDAAMSYGGAGMLARGSARRILYSIETFLLRQATQVLALSEPMRKRTVEKGVSEDRTWLFPNWSDTQFVRPMQRNNEVRQEFGARPDDVLVLHAGNMGEKQGLDLVLDAADQLRDRTEIKFAMVGDGAARERLKRLAEQRKLNNVRFFPVQPLERLPLMLAAGDIHLVVQKREAADLVMPSKLNNILAAGRPCIATVDPDTALHSVLSEHGCGVITPPGSARELAKSIVLLTEDAELRERLGLNARRYAESNLDKDKILTQFESRVRKLVKIEK